MSAAANQALVGKAFMAAFLGAGAGFMLGMDAWFLGNITRDKQEKLVPDWAFGVTTGAGAVVGALLVLGLRQEQLWRLGPAVRGMWYVAGLGFVGGLVPFAVDHAYRNAEEAHLVGGAGAVLGTTLGLLIAADIVTRPK